MEKSIVAAKTPKMVTLEPGTYFWCACGRSSTQPFCDGSHKEYGFVPMAFKVEEKKDIWLCRCKLSKNKPYCDGTHREL